MRHAPRQSEASEVLVVYHINVLKERKEKTGAPFCGGSGKDAGVTRGRWPNMF